MKNVALCFASAVLVIAADVLIKKASTAYSWSDLFQSAPMLWAYGMYLVQIVLAVLVFRYANGIAIYTNLFVVFYSIFGVLSGLFLFKERLNTTQWAGIALGIIASLMLNQH